MLFVDGEITWGQAVRLDGEADQVYSCNRYPLQIAQIWCS